MSDATTNGSSGGDAVIGVDVGGTHTDAMVILGDRVERGKALTTYDDFSKGVLNAIGVAAENLELSLEDLLGQTTQMVNGTTVVTNAIAQLRGSKVGVLVTAGFKDTFRFSGGPRLAAYDDHLQVNVPDLVDRNAIAEIDERIDYAGSELAPVDGDQVEREVRRLVEEEGIEALAICFLSSFVDADHELEAERKVNEIYPDLFVTPSHRVFPVLGENRRWTTAVLNSFVQERARGYLLSLDDKLREAGLEGGLAFFQGLGGGISREKAETYPLALLGSGPAGGAIGANELAKTMGAKKVLLGDMGGTSFDTGIINDNEIQIEKNIELGPFETGVNLVDVVSIGAGGGSIAWVGERGVPQVGPRSAGSTPGPACYDAGGTEPTVTDAMVTMGFIDPDRYLGGRVDLSSDLAEKSLQPLAERFDWSIEQAAAAVHDLVVANMANAMREVSVEKGHDPRDFVFLAYGGTLPLFGVQIAERLGMETIVIPSNSSVFCARGLLASDFILRYDKTVGWDLSKAGEVDGVNEVTEEMMAAGRADMEAQGFAGEQITIERGADFRFVGQAYELTMALPDRPLTADDAPQLAKDFFELYERTYGEGTAWQGVPELLLNSTVTVTGRQSSPSINGNVESTPAPAADLEMGRRSVFLPAEKERAEAPIYDDSKFTVGSKIEGPAIIDATDTTVYVPPRTEAERDRFMNYVLTRS